MPAFNDLPKTPNGKKEGAKLVCVNIVTADTERLSSFYRDILGAWIDESHGGPNRIEIWFGPPNDATVCIVANYAEEYKRQDYGVCQGFELRVRDADAEYKRIRGLGIQASQPKDLPWGYRYFSIPDPDGNGVDIVQAL